MESTAPTDPVRTDAVVIGAGPVGLFQVFQLGLQGIQAHLIDALPHTGGQCVELYGDKPIYDIPGIAVCTGRELAERLLAQIAPFDPAWHLGQLVSGLTPLTDGGFRVETSTGTLLHTRTVFIAAGVGAFVPRTLKVEGIDRFAGTQVHYQQLPPGISVSGQTVVVNGGDEGAVAAAVALADAAAPDGPARTVLLHRRDHFQAPAALLDRLAALRASGRIDVVVGQITGIDATPERLTALVLVDADGATQHLPTDLLLPVLGISPRLGPVADWGLALERKQLVVDTATFATSVPGIYAVGDINTYPGKRKLILCGFHEATLAAFAAAEAISGDKVALQYTTTSPRLQQRLGVLAGASPAADALH